MKNSIIAVERMIWKSGVNACRQYILEDAVIVLGEDQAVSREKAISMFERLEVEGRQWFNVHLNDFQCVTLDKNTAIISYRASGNVHGRQSALHAQCTSLYMRRAGQLRLAFHQQAPAK